MRAFLHRATPFALLIGIGLLANGPSSGQEVVGARPIERAPPVVTTNPSTHIDLHPVIPPLPAVPLSPTIGNTPSCCGATTTAGTGANSSFSGGGGDEGGGAEAVASPAENDALAESVVDTMMAELPIVGKQRGAE
jgi:hypothetical protein